MSLSPKYKHNTAPGHCSKTWRQQSCDSLPDQHSSLKFFLLLPFFFHCESPHSGQKDVLHKLALLTTQLPFIHSFIPRVQSALCCAGGKLSWVWLWCLLSHSFPKWLHSTHCSALTSQRLLVGSTAFYSLPASKWQLNEEKKPCLGAPPVLWEGPSVTTQILHNHPRQKFSWFACPCKQHTERWGAKASTSHFPLYYGKSRRWLCN